jgi:hypothetical protein
MYYTPAFSLLVIGYFVGTHTQVWSQDKHDYKNSIANIRLLYLFSACILLKMTSVYISGLCSFCFATVSKHVFIKKKD